MTRRWTLLAGALALCLSAPQAAVAADPPPSSPASPAPDAAATRALSDLRADADGAVRVQRDDAGDVAFVGSTNGQAMVDSDAASPKAAAQNQLAEYGDAFGIDGDVSKTAFTQTLDSATGGTVVRTQQVVDGVPVFGGQVVLSLDKDQGLVSVSSATTEAAQVPSSEVSEGRAGQAALAAIAKYHRVRATGLTLTKVGRRLYDPTLVHQTDPRGTRPVWQFEVSNGSDVRETVLVGTGRGDIALHFNQAPTISRRVCDNTGLASTSSSTAVPVCSDPARSEGGLDSVVEDVNQAYDNLGATSQAYADLDGIDLTDRIGATVSGTKSLQATVRWCYSDEPCPYENAFWNGTQMVFGAGYAGADDVVGHELTHGYVERTSGLFYLHQSGAINESVADIIGEIVDHRNPASPDADAGWTIGEDLGVDGALRSLEDPTLFGQPDRMTSDNWDSGDVYDDSGAVHQNDGVGNKTAYLISQGGTFNGRTVAGIDAGDPLLAKTGRLYLETIPRLTSGSEYADLGTTLGSTCDQLVAAQTGGFAAADCTSVRNAVAATELALPPADAAGTAPEVATCPTGHTAAAQLSDNDAHHDFQWTYGLLWQRTPAGNTPSYAHEGTSSLFGWDPDPDAFDDPTSSSATSAGFVVPDGKSFLHFHHAYLLEWWPGDENFPDVEYYDGAQVLIQTPAAGGGWTTVSGLPWVNGPNRTVQNSAAQGLPAWSGDSHGYGSSRVDLTSLAGQTVRVVLRVVADAEGSMLGWWVDDLGLYSCEPLPPSAPRGVTVKAGLGRAVVSWLPPANPGGGVTQYFVYPGTGNGTYLPASTRRTTITQKGFGQTVSISAVSGGYEGPRVGVRITSTDAHLTPSTTKVRKNRYFTLTATMLRLGSSIKVRGMPLVLQRRLSAARPWARMAVGSTNVKGVKAWRVKQTRTTQYRVVATGFSGWYGDITPIRVIRKR